MSAIGGAGLLARDGAGGFGFAALPANQRDRRGGGKAIPQPFDPTFEKDDETGEIHLSSIGPGYAPWGRNLVYVAPPGSSSDVWSTPAGRLGIKITHPTVDVGPDPSVELVILDSHGSDDDVTYLPLYDFADGRITLDLRCYLALGVFE